MPARPRGRPPLRATAAYTSRYADDVGAQRLVELHPDGVPLEVIGAHLGMSRERVRQIQDTALARIESALTRDGLDASDFAAWLASRPESESDRSTPSAPERHERMGLPDWRERGSLPVEAWSEHGQCVEAACAALDSIAEMARARREIARVVEGMAL